MGTPDRQNSDRIHLPQAARVLWPAVGSASCSSGIGAQQRESHGGSFMGGDDAL